MGPIAITCWHSRSLIMARRLTGRNLSAFSPTEGTADVTGFHCSSYSDMAPPVSNGDHHMTVFKDGVLTDTSWFLNGLIRRAVMVGPIKVRWMKVSDI